MTKKETESREPIIIVGLGENKFPRIEVYVDSQGCTVGVKDESADEPLKRVVYGMNTPTSIINLLDKKILSERMTRGRAKDYNPTLKNFLLEIQDHNRFMQELVHKEEFFITTNV